MHLSPVVFCNCQCGANYVPLICFLSMLYVYCTFASCLVYKNCLFALLKLGKVSISIAPISFLSFSSVFPKGTVNLLSARCVYLYNFPSLFYCSLSLPFPLLSSVPGWCPMTILFPVAFFVLYLFRCWYCDLSLQVFPFSTCCVGYVL